MTIRVFDEDLSSIDTASVTDFVAAIIEATVSVVKLFDEMDPEIRPSVLSSVIVTVVARCCDEPKDALAGVIQKLPGMLEKALREMES
jgi:hypothetical protein